MAHLDAQLDALAGFTARSAMERILLLRSAMVAIDPSLASPFGDGENEPLAARRHEHPARFEQLFVRSYAWVWRTLRRLGVHEAQVDDAAQQVFLIASHRIGQIESGKERAFLISVAVRTAANARRSQTRRREDPDEEAIDRHGDSTSPEELLEWKQRREKLDEWLASLALELRTPFVLFELEGLSIVEIAEMLELPLGTVKTRLRKARAIFLQVAEAQSSAFVAATGKVGAR